MRPELWEAHDYQNNAVNFVLQCFEREGSAALFLEPGFGKTSITLEVFRILRSKGLAKKMLVLAPLRVAQSTWPFELYRWLNFNGITYTVLHGLHKDRAAMADVDVYIMNYEGLQWLLSRRVFWTIDMLVMDELTRLKSWTSKRVKSLKPFLPTFKYRLGLTGTPAPNGFEDLFSQIYMLDRGKRFSHKKTKFLDTYFEAASPYTFKRGIKRNAGTAICNLLDDLCYSLRPDDWLKLPQELFNYIYLDLPPPLRLQYEELKKEAILELQSAQLVTAQTAAVLTTKLRQFLSGTIYVDIDGTAGVEIIHDIKYEFLKDFIEDLNEPLLIAYQYRHEANRLVKYFPQAVLIGSGTSQKVLTTTIAEWNKGNIPILIGHPQSIGHGLNLQGGGRHILFFSVDYNLETYLQFIKRLSRQGQSAEHVFIHHLLFKETIDEHILKVLQGKDTLQKGLLEFLVDA